MLTGSSVLFGTNLTDDFLRPRSGGLHLSPLRETVDELGWRYLRMSLRVVYVHTFVEHARCTVLKQALVPRWPLLHLPPS